MHVLLLEKTNVRHHNFPARIRLTIDTLPLKKKKAILRKSARPRATPRQVAVNVLSEWFSREAGQRPPLEKLTANLVERAGLRQSDRALCWEIVFGTVRWFRLVEWHLKKFLKKPNKLPLPVRMILFTGAYQIIFLSRIPFFAAVDESVKIANALGFPWARSIVNAVLRKISTCTTISTVDEIFIRKRCGELNNFLNCLSVFSSHPHWMVKRWEKQWGREKALSICVNNNTCPPLTIRVNTLKTNREKYLGLLEKTGIKAEKGLVSPWALRLTGFRGRIETLPGFQAGLFQIQDEASQTISMLLSPRPGLTVLDACAGVGGKSMHIADIMKDQGLILCTDTSRQRLKTLVENTERLDVNIIKSRYIPGIGVLQDKYQHYFDRVLVDAPCSGTGVIRRHPDIKWNRKPGMVEEFSQAQARLLKEAAPLLKPGGIMVYSVCTLEKEETEQVIDAFLASHADFSLVPVSTPLSGSPTASKKQDESPISCGQRFFRTLPGQLDMDGFFAAVFKRQAAI